MSQRELRVPFLINVVRWAQSQASAGFRRFPDYFLLDEEPGNKLLTKLVSALGNIEGEEEEEDEGIYNICGHTSSGCFT